MSLLWTPLGSFTIVSRIAEVRRIAQVSRAGRCVGLATIMFTMQWVLLSVHVWKEGDRCRRRRPRHLRLAT